MEDQIGRARDQRSRIKSRITSLSHKISAASKRNETTVSELHDNFEDLFVQFHEAHGNFCDFVKSDEKYEQYGKVSGLDLDEYLSTVIKVYDDVNNAYAQYKSQAGEKLVDSLNHSTALTMKEATQVLHVFAELIERKAAGSALHELTEQANVFIASLKDCHSRLNECGSTGTNLVSSIDNIILDLHGFVIKSEQLSDTHSIPQSFPLPRRSVLFTPHIGSDVASVYRESDNESVRCNRKLRPSALASSNSMSKFKKTEPPIFSDNRAAWSEFCNMWRRYAEQAYASDEERAWALKQSLSGKAANYVRSIFVTRADAYNKIWK